MATQNPVALPGGRLCPLRIEVVLLGWGLLVWGGSEGPLCPSVSFFLGAMLIFHGLHQRQKAENRFLQGENRRWSREEGWRASW